MINNRIINLIYRRYFLLLATLLVAVSIDVYGQSPDLSSFYNNDYKPKELNISSADRLDKLFTYYAEKNDAIEKSDYEDFVFRSNYFLEKLNSSGQVFYGDKISQYLNTLKDILLEGHESKDEIQIYLTRHPSVNAFTNDFGDIYVNIATISKLESELELLAILAHEISHIHNQHTHQFEQFRKDVDGDNWKGDEETLVLKQHVFSQEQEYAADMDGFKLLVDKGIDCKKAEKVFEKLRFDLDPNLKGVYASSHLACGHPYAGEYFTTVKGGIKRELKNIKENVNDSLRTHPSTIKRYERINQFIDSLSPQVSYSTTGQFVEMRNIANHVLVNTYIENGWLIECLDLIAKLRIKSPSDPYLLKSQAKVLLLFTQEKYRTTPFNQFINAKGSAYRDTAYLEFSETLLSFNSFEMNVYALLVVDHIRKRHNIAYLDRTHDFLIQFLYKYNPGLFKNTNDKLALKTPLDLDSNSLRVNDLSIFLNLTKDEQKVYRELKSEHNLLPIEVRSVEDAQDLLSYFLNNYALSDSDREAIVAYKRQRNKYELMLTLDQVFISLHPYESLINYHRGVYNKTSKQLSLDSVALVQSSSYFLDGYMRDYQIDFKKSLQLEKQMIQSLNLNDQINQNFSNLALQKISVKDINQHFALMQWLDERFLFEDLIYSAVDEQIEAFKSKSGIRYLLFNLNGTSRNKGLPPKHITYGYNVYFDLESEGITYISKIASKAKGNDMIFRQLFHLSNYNID